MTLTCSAPLTPAQWEFLQTADYELRRVRFHPDDTESSELLLDDDILVSKMPVGDSSNVNAEFACQCRGQITAVMVSTAVETSSRQRQFKQSHAYYHSCPYYVSLLWRISLPFYLLSLH